MNGRRDGTSHVRQSGERGTWGRPCLPPCSAVPSLHHCRQLLASGTTFARCRCATAVTATAPTPRPLPLPHHLYPLPVSSSTPLPAARCCDQLRAQPLVPQPLGPVQGRPLTLGLRRAADHVRVGGDRGLDCMSATAGHTGADGTEGAAAVRRASPHRRSRPGRAARPHRARPVGSSNALLHAGRLRSALAAAEQQQPGSAWPRASAASGRHRPTRVTPSIPCPLDPDQPFGTQLWELGTCPAPPPLPRGRGRRQRPATLSPLCTAAAAACVQPTAPSRLLAPPLHRMPPAACRPASPHPRPAAPPACCAPPAAVAAHPWG